MRVRTFMLLTIAALAAAVVAGSGLSAGAAGGCHGGPKKCDKVAPSAPTGLAVSGVGQDVVTLSWQPANDNVGVTSYDLYRGSTNVATLGASRLSYQFTGLTCATAYTLGVAAGDAAGNHSSIATVDATTSACSSGGSTHVVWVVMENHSYEQIIGNTSSAPYINSLAQQYGSATNMQAESHPSLPNYVAMTSGSTQGITDDMPPASHPLSVENIFHQLPGGRSRSLEESMPSSCYKTNSSPYVVRHNPEAYYTNLGSDCASYDVPLGTGPDLSAAFTFITPNVCHDMHSNSCPGSADTILQGDQWLQGFVPKLLATPQYQAGNTVIFITWDEGSGSNHIPTLVISPTTSRVQSSTAFTHYSMLRTTEEILGVPLIGGAVSAASMRSAFHL
jgi:phosphatidylinositol-3-phosphatase